MGVVNVYLEKTTPKYWNATGSIKVNKLKNVSSALGDHGDTENEQGYTQANCELTAYRPVRVTYFNFNTRIKLICNLRVSGYMSTMPVTRLSTMQNSLSMPITTSMKKKMTAQTLPPVILRTTSG